jgi:hypothetical protein
MSQHQLPASGLFSMSNLGEVWEALRGAGLEHLAPSLVRHGVVSLNQLVLRYDELHASGLTHWQLESILAAAHPPAAGPGDESQDGARVDLPVRQMGKRASIQAALEAARPNQRQRSLQALDQDVLARTTNPAVEARVRTYLAICRAWEIQAFPLDNHNIRCFGASLKAGGYRSAAVYYQAVCGHQQRALQTPVPTMVKLGIRDCIRSIQRGLGESKLKDAFNGLLLGNIPPSTDEQPFSFGNTDHCRDMAVIGLWFMLRESELASARACDLRLEAKEVFLSIPLHKTDHRGRFTERSLTCSCNTRVHGLCVWHSAERHLVRLEAFRTDAPRSQLPLFPGEDGRTASKQEFIEAIRAVIAQTGTSLTRPGPDGQESQRFHGHTLRISGAQMLSSSGVELALIQLLGRWTSTAVLRYTQDSALVRAPQLPQQVLAGDQSLNQPIHLQVSQPALSAAPSTPAPRPAAPAARPKAFAAAVRGLQAELAQVKQAVQRPTQTFVFRPKAKILHKASQHEDDNEPLKWRTPCGWGYGSRTFLRTSNELDGSRKCRKCFNMSEDSSSESSEASSGVSAFNETSASSAEDE